MSGGVRDFDERKRIPRESMTRSRGGALGCNFRTKRVSFSFFFFSSSCKPLVLYKEHEEVQNVRDMENLI